MNAQEFFVMSIPAMVAIAGGLLAAAWSPSHQARSLTPHFAAGGTVLLPSVLGSVPLTGASHTVIGGTLAF
jgi:ZIP family zinc transporter